MRKWFDEGVKNWGGCDFVVLFNLGFWVRGIWFGDGLF